MPNKVIQRDLNVKEVKDKIEKTNEKYQERIETHPNSLADVKQNS